MVTEVLFTGVVSILPSIVAALSAYFIITISPGPANFAVMRTAMREGKRAGLCLGAGIVCGSICWGTIAATGLATFLSSNLYAFSIVKVLGGMYLCWMSYKAISSAFLGKAEQLSSENKTNNQLTLWRAYLQGFFIHITNPKAVFAWGAVMTLGLQPNVSMWLLASTLITGGCLLQGIVVSSYALIFSTKTVVNFYNSFYKVIESVLGVLFGGAGCAMLLSISSN